MVLGQYDSVTITLTLPEGLTWYDFGYLSIWCRTAVESFGHINMPANAILPPFIEEDLVCSKFDEINILMITP